MVVEHDTDARWGRIMGLRQAQELHEFGNVILESIY